MSLTQLAGFTPKQEFEINVAIVCGLIAGILCIIMPFLVLKRLKNLGLRNKATAIMAALLLPALAGILVAVFIITLFGPKQ